MTEQYKIFEKSFIGTSNGNPYKEVEFKADFSSLHEKITVYGFYNGNGEYILRFMPQYPGKYTAVTSSNDDALDHLKFSFEVTPASKNNHGRVLTQKDVCHDNRIGNYDDENRFHFLYEDGTRFLPFGTTCYAMIHQSKEVQKQTYETLKTSPFNKVRMCIFPKFYTYNTADPDNYPFTGNREDGFNFEEFNPVFWNHLDQWISQLDELHIQADIILFHPYDRWGFSKMTKQQDIFYLEYAIRRLSAHKNIWWSLANEFDLLPHKSIEDWESYARVILNNDPYGHLRSIHNCIRFYDHNRSWITHCSIQRVDVYKTSESVTEWRQEYQKPIVVDECAYEGNINYGWGNITGEEMTRRFWEGCIRGGYLSHGETYVDKGNEIWWAHGGKLYGSSPARIQFLKEILYDTPLGSCPLKLTPENHEANWDVPCLHYKDEYFLYYFGFFRPSFRTYELPQGNQYQIELIDTWNMTIRNLGIFEGNIKIDMPSLCYMAIRMKKI